jgi:hypothetical protein
MRVRSVVREPDAVSGNLRCLQYIGRPFYVKPTISRRWGLKAWLLWTFGGHVPAADLPEYKPEGYRIEDLGPSSLQGRGVAEMQVASCTIQQIQNQLLMGKRHSG